MSNKKKGGGGRLKIHDLCFRGGHENNVLLLATLRADRERGCSILNRALCICEARRQEHNNHELGRTKQQEFSLKVSTEREENVEEGSRLFGPRHARRGESASLSRAVCGGPKDDSL